MSKELKFFVLVFVMVLGSSFANAQGILERLGQRAVEHAKARAEQKVEQKVDESVDKAVDAAFDAPSKALNKGKKNNDDNDAEVEESESSPEPESAAKPKKKAQVEDVKSDFVQGTVVIFEDDFAGEQMGEFPSKWDLLENNAEVARVNGKKAIKFEHGENTRITPLIKDGNRKYLPEVYTLEFDYFVTDEEEHTSSYWLYLAEEGEDSYNSTIDFSRERIGWSVQKPTGGETQGGANIEPFTKMGDWNHFALSFNKRALKVYINNRRVINIPNAKALDWFNILTEFWEDHIDYITNVRLAKGGVELYERNAQSMTPIEKAIAETGRFVTNNILFETGKADIKSESMDEIKKVAEYMKKNPNARFEVQGHTDNQGSDKINDPLSQKRAEAIVNALVQMGCDEFNLRAVGKGSHEPVADNKTEAGRAQNRRVVFVKK